MNNDTRRHNRAFFAEGDFSQFKALTMTAAWLLVAGAVAWLPGYAGLDTPGRWALFVLVFAALMWISEAIPAFATSLLTIGLLIAVLGRPGGGFASGPRDWEVFIRPWGSPLIWLFFGGFCLASAAHRTGLDRWMTRWTLARFGNAPAWVLLGVMLTTAVLSMFMSNTATATVMLAVLSPLIAGRPPGDPLLRALLLGVAFAGNIGGMGTLIGTPPNAIAAGVLANDGAPIDFARWMLLATPPALLLLLLAWGYLLVRCMGRGAFAAGEGLQLDSDTRATNSGSVMQPAIVVLTFAVTVLLWMTSPLTGLPTTVASFVPICVLTASGVLTADDVRALPWDILLLITGGLSLGVAIEKTGLAEWVLSGLPTDRLPAFALVLGFGYLTLVLSNLMSNTAAANVVLPLAAAALAAGDVRLVTPIALCASMAMCLPISTPPNAIVYASGRLTTGDLLAAGLVVGVVGPLVVTGWCLLLLRWV